MHTCSNWILIVHNDRYRESQCKTWKQTCVHKCMPDSRCGAIPYYNVQEDPEAAVAAPTLHSSMETIACTDLDATEEYWPLENTRDGADNSNQPDTTCPRQGDAHKSNTMSFKKPGDDVDNSNQSVTPH